MRESHYIPPEYRGRMLDYPVHRHLKHSIEQWENILTANIYDNLPPLSPRGKVVAEEMKRAGSATDYSDAFFNTVNGTVGEAQQRADDLLDKIDPLIGKPSDGTDPVLDAQEITDILARGAGGVVPSEAAEHISDVEFEGLKKQWNDTFDGPEDICETLLELTRLGSKARGAKPIVYTLDFPTLCIRIECENPVAFVAAGLCRIYDGPVSSAYRTVIGSGDPIR